MTYTGTSDSEKIVLYLRMQITNSHEVNLFYITVILKLSLAKQFQEISHLWSANPEPHTWDLYRYPNRSQQER